MRHWKYANWDLVLGVSAWRLDGEKLSHAGNRVERAMNLGPTIYPLAFAAIGSRCLRSIAIRFAERGTTVGVCIDDLIPITI